MIRCMPDFCAKCQSLNICHWKRAFANLFYFKGREMSFKSGQQDCLSFSVTLKMCYFLRKYFLSSDGMIMG